MIIYYFGKVYYSRTLSWACTTLVLLSVPAAALAWHLRPHECLSQESQALAMLAVDYWLAATLLSGPLWYLLAYSFARMDDDQPELLALRGTSAVIVAAASTTLVVQVLPRLVLASATALYVGLSLNLGCWWASLWLRLQTDGLAAHLPPSVRRALLHERPIDWLRRSDWTEMVLRARQMLPLLLLPDGELRHGLAQLPPRLRRRLERPGLAALLPNTARQLLKPWATGPDLLRHQLQQAVGPVAAAALETALVRLADFGASAELRAVVGALAALAVGRRLCGVSSGEITHGLTLRGAQLSWAILEGEKVIENRTVSLPAGWIAIHTGRAPH
ncbi:hypothetical protein Ctob_012724 [Chrysochromulina tobinii]|uniref:Uncharacterized protein n=1 Tax=Chrysochromulina tobinii TaxID=1460289 RepID=A0A0M0K8T8_9EUKA|nr:hypothetical protein Ctob_012724 [Chrysochromulina tobinii]|eukprot:KOO35219.1 hypothetical protein Ctob_012724 [Chrysochromulina sp. CCMP291]